jgi:hypothetical protein
MVKVMAQVAPGVVLQTETSVSPRWGLWLLTKLPLGAISVADDVLDPPVDVSFEPTEELVDVGVVAPTEFEAVLVLGWANAVFALDLDEEAVVLITAVLASGAL